MIKYRGYNIHIIKKKDSNRFYYNAFKDDDSIFIDDNFGSSTRKHALKSIKKVIDKRAEN